jgi:hypothetical protein
MPRFFNGLGDLDELGTVEVLRLIQVGGPRGSRVEGGGKAAQ